MLIQVTQIDTETVRNTASQALHSQCGFVPTEEPPRNPWGELEEETVLFRFSRTSYSGRPHGAAPTYSMVQIQ